MGLYYNNGGNLSYIAGRGKAEYGASTVRTGTITINEIGIGGYARWDITFDSPMPDDSYQLTYNWDASGGNVTFAIVSFISKTKNGFSVMVRNADMSVNPIVNHVLTWCAFKLFTVQGLEALENDVATLKEDNRPLTYHKFTTSNEVWEFRGSVGLIYYSGSNYGHGIYAYSCGYNDSPTIATIQAGSGIKVEAGAVSASQTTITLTATGSVPLVVYVQEFSRPQGS